jgi:hypothetical protein
MQGVSMTRKKKKQANSIDNGNKGMATRMSIRRSDVARK